MFARVAVTVAVNDTVGKRHTPWAIFSGQPSSARCCKRGRVYTRRERHSPICTSSFRPFELPDPNEDMRATIQRIVDQRGQARAGAIAGLSQRVPAHADALRSAASN
jgi:hypothetical protein